MKVREFKKLMRQVRKECQPDKNWVNNTRDFLMAKIEHGLPEEFRQKTKLPFWLRLADTLVPENFAFRPVAVFSLILGLFLITSFASVNASKDTLPGDTLYPVKITAENIKYNLTFSDEQKVRVAMSMVENRVSEVKKIVKEENGQKEIKVTQVTQKIKSGLKIVKDKVQVINEKSDNEKVVATVKEIDKKLALVESEVNQTTQEAKGEVADKLAEVVNEVEKTSAVVLAILEDKKDVDGEQIGLSEDEVASDVEVTEEAATSTASTSEQEVQGVATEQIFSTTSEVILPLIIEKEVEEVEEFKVKIGE